MKAKYEKEYKESKNKQDRSNASLMVALNEATLQLLENKPENKPLQDELLNYLGISKQVNTKQKKQSQ